MNQRRSSKERGAIFSRAYPGSASPRWSRAQRYGHHRVPTPPLRRGHRRVFNSRSRSIVRSTPTGRVSTSRLASRIWPARISRSRNTLPPSGDAGGGDALSGGVVAGPPEHGHRGDQAWPRAREAAALRRSDSTARAGAGNVIEAGGAVGELAAAGSRGSRHSAGGLWSIRGRRASSSGLGQWCASPDRGPSADG